LDSVVITDGRFDLQIGTYSRCSPWGSHNKADLPFYMLSPVNWLTLIGCTN
jgi:hypothetical protein